MSKMKQPKINALNQIFFNFVNWDDDTDFGLFLSPLLLWADYLSMRVITGKTY